MNQYSNRNNVSAAYDNNGNLTVSVDGSSYTYDAQNRLTSAYKNGTTETFKYDGLNRQVSRTVNGVTTYNVYDGWDLMGEFANSATSPSAAYTHGAGGLVKEVLTNNYYYQDGSGSTSHLASSSGALLEWYRYDLQGTPIFNDNPQQTTSNFGVRHLFTGQQWYSELGLYDLRNRFYSPDIGRFLQPDPIGFGGDPTNLYRYCGNNPVTWTDPSGLVDNSEGWGKFAKKTEELQAPYSDGLIDRLVKELERQDVQHAAGPAGRALGSYASESISGGGSVGDGRGLGGSRVFSQALNVLRSFVTAVDSLTGGPQYRQGLQEYLQWTAINRAASPVWMQSIFTSMEQTGGIGMGAPIGATSEAFHYTFGRVLASIRSQGLRPGSYATPNGMLRPLQAQIDLALAPNRGLPNVVLRVDLAGLRQAGYQIPEVTRVGRSFGMPGGGFEMQFPYPVPPEFITVITP